MTSGRVRALVHAGGAWRVCHCGCRLRHAPPPLVTLARGGAEAEAQGVKGSKRGHTHEGRPRQELGRRAWGKSERASAKEESAGQDEERWRQQTARGGKLKEGGGEVGGKSGPPQGLSARKWACEPSRNPQRSPEERLWRDRQRSVLRAAAAAAEGSGARGPVQPGPAGVVQRLRW